MLMNCHVFISSTDSLEIPFEIDIIGKFQVAKFK